MQQFPHGLTSPSNYLMTAMICQINSRAKFFCCLELLVFPLFNILGFSFKVKINFSEYERNLKDTNEMEK